VDSRGIWQGWIAFGHLGGFVSLLVIGGFVLQIFIGGFVSQIFIGGFVSLLLVGRDVRPGTGPHRIVSAVRGSCPPPLHPSAPIVFGRPSASLLDFIERQCDIL
jgi:hypothetical protein